MRGAREGEGVGEEGLSKLRMTRRAMEDEIERSRQLTADLPSRSHRSRSRHFATAAARLSD